MTGPHEIAGQYAARAQDLLQIGKVDEARQEIKLGLKAIPDDIPLLQILADLLDGTNRAEEAVAVCDRLSLLLPHDPLVRVKAGQLWVRTGDYARAEQAFNAALAIDPGSADAINGLTEIWQRAGQISEAKAVFRERASASPTPEDRAAYRLRAALVQPVIVRDNTEITQMREELASTLAAGPDTPFRTH